MKELDVGGSALKHLIALFLKTVMMDEYLRQNNNVHVARINVNKQV